MTREEYWSICEILDTLETEERDRANRYMNLNPSDKRRLDDAGIYQQALMDIRRGLRKLYQTERKTA